MAFSLKLFGGITLESAAGVPPVPAQQRHRLALLALLATARAQAMSREKLMAWLWPERDSDPARRLLNQGVHVLRQALGPEAILSVGEDLQLNAGVVHCDVTAFEAALARGDTRQAVALYAGPFLDGFFLDGAGEFEQWAEGERHRLAGARGKALEELAERAEQAGDAAEAVEWWTARAGQDPYDSRVAMRLMVALERAGNPAGALQHAATHRQLLRDELEIESIPELDAMVERLRRAPAERTPSFARDSVARPIAVDAPVATGPGPEPGDVVPVAPPRRPRISAPVTAGLVVVLLAGGGMLLLSRDTPQAPAATSAGVDEIAVAVARELERRRGGDTAVRLPRHRTKSVAAYEMYLRGDNPALLRSDTGAQQALEYFRRAIALDSTYAAAWAGFARLRFRTAGYSPRARQAAGAESERALRTALALDDSLAEAHALLGVLRTRALDYPEAERHFARAIALAPREARNREWFTGFYLMTGRAAEALAEAYRAVAADPLSPSANAEVARALLANDRCEEALERLAPLRDLDPPLLRARSITVQCLARLGRWDEALALLGEDASGPDQIDRLPHLGYVLARAGKHAEALAVHDSLRNYFERGSIGAYFLAFVPAALGDRDEAFRWLQRAVDDGSLGFSPGFSAGIFGAPFDVLHDDPRMNRLKESLRLQNR